MCYASLPTHGPVGSGDSARRWAIKIAAALRARFRFPIARKAMFTAFVTVVAHGTQKQNQALVKPLGVGDFVMHRERPQQGKAARSTKLGFLFAPLNDFSPSVRSAIEEVEAK